MVVLVLVFAVVPVMTSGTMEDKRISNPLVQGILVRGSIVRRSW